MTMTEYVIAMFAKQNVKIDLGAVTPKSRRFDGVRTPTAGKTIAALMMRKLHSSHTVT